MTVRDKGMAKICGEGLSCEQICPMKAPGEECRVTMLELALSLDRCGGLTPQGGEVWVPVLLV